ncbi:PspC domain-containing protein [Candidatus Dojkabacteria bacterium]|nr:PspC domain-containing protein [Candidatus Dojkabacteria bacterium]
MSDVESQKKNQRIYRSETNKVIAGVCGGLGEFFNIDPVIIRLIFVLMVLFGGSGMLIYLIMWIIVPLKSSVSQSTEATIKQNAKEFENKAKKAAVDLEKTVKKTDTKLWFGLIILFLGFFFLLQNFGINLNPFRFINFSILWPILIIFLGILIVIKKNDD